MTAEGVTLGFFRCLWDGDLEGALTWCSPDAQFEFAPSLPYPSPAPMRQALQSIMQDMYTKFDTEKGLQVTVEHLMSKGDDVAIEYLATGLLRDGREYRNRYLTYVLVQQGRVRLLRPYTDTAYVSSTLLHSG
ncbi:MAG: nuclear transport factor 2 family protein [Proteobacteria bacterium]|nr:nuclear transport factor 2 family protein [Pseudomonadota bacterium]